MAFKRAGMPIRWEGPKGTVQEFAVVTEGERKDQVVIRIDTKYFRPTEVRLLPAHFSAVACTERERERERDLQMFQPPRGTFRSCPLLHLPEVCGVHGWEKENSMLPAT
jgi:hypothetical protein